jgi:hypothetical protein
VVAGWATAASAAPSANPQTQTQTISGDIYLCGNPWSPNSEVSGGTLTVTAGPTTIASQPNPLGPVSVPAGTYTMAATAPSGYQLVSCGRVSNDPTQSVTVPAGRAGFGIFYVAPSRQSISFSGNSGDAIVSQTLFEIQPPTWGTGSVFPLSTNSNTGSSITSGPVWPIPEMVLILQYNQRSAASSVSVSDSYGLSWVNTSTLWNGADIESAWYAIVPADYAGGAIRVTVADSASGATAMQIIGVTSDGTVVQSLGQSYWTTSSGSETFVSLPAADSTVVAAMAENNTYALTNTNTPMLRSFPAQVDPAATGLTQFFYSVGEGRFSGPFRHRWPRHPRS